MFFVLFGLWILMNGQWTTELAIIGVVLSGLLYLLMWKFMDYSPRREWQFFKRFPRMLGYICYLVREVFKSAFATIRLIWSPKQVVEPVVVSFQTKLKSGWGKVVLANSITLTPGTITVNVQGDRMLVHCIDNSFDSGLEGSEMEARILKVEGDVDHA